MGLIFAETVTIILDVYKRQEGDKPETCMVPDYTVRTFKDVEQEYLEIFEKYKVL